MNIEQNVNSQGMKQEMKELISRRKIIVSVSVQFFIFAHNDLINTMFILCGVVTYKLNFKIQEGFHNI